MRAFLKLIVISLFEFNILNYISSTIDINAGELQYIADHLTLEECRTLVAAAHFKSYEKPNALDQAERKIPKDESCIDLLYHWNSIEGKGETHEELEHRLRQMQKYELADWLGRTVFNKLVEDSNRSLEIGLEKFATEESTSEIDQIAPSLAPVIEPEESSWTLIDSFLWALIIGLILVISGLCFIVCWNACVRWAKKRKERKVKLKKFKSYKLLENESGSESEDKFDVRNYKSDEVS